MISIKTDSRKVCPGDIFLALTDLGNDGHQYIDKAIANGAKTVVVSKDVEISDPTVKKTLVPDTRKYLLSYLRDNYKDKLDEMTLIGITGTNGKTTTCYVVAQMLNYLGHKCAYIGTIGFYMGEKVRDIANTTPDSCELYEYLLEAYDAGYKTVALEASSHGLTLGRLDTITFDYAGFTNLTEAHLEFHKSREEYALAKQQLFRMLRPDGVAIVNADDPYTSYYLLEGNNNRTYGFEPSDYRLLNYEMSGFSCNFEFRFRNELYNISAPIIGVYNVYNLMLVTAILTEMGFEHEQIAEAAARSSLPPGRMNLIPWGEKRIVIDYAHTPDGLEKAVDAVREVLGDGHLITLFCCRGRRDPLMRPLMTDYACKYSDLAILSGDHTYDEAPEHIIAEATVNVTAEDPLEIIWDRNEAIDYAMCRLQDGDVLLILGKGYEKYNIVNGQKMPIDDIARVHKNIAKGK